MCKRSTRLVHWWFSDLIKLEAILPSSVENHNSVQFVLSIPGVGLTRSGNPMLCRNTNMVPNSFTAQMHAKLTLPVEKQNT